jgi:multidrug efflux system membrane fusion protein
MSSELNGADTAGVSPPPEPRANRRLAQRAMVVLLIFFTGIALLLYFAERGKPAHAYAPPAVPVVAATAQKGDLPIYLNGLGSVTPLYTVTVRTRVDGQLFSIPVNEGQMISAGDVIAEIDPRPFEVQLLQAQGQKERDEAILANAKVDLERYRILYSEDSVPKQQLDTQAATVNQYEAIVKSDEGAIESAKLNLTYARITSPISGRIGLRNVDPGNIVHATDQSGLVVITQLQPITVIFNIAEDYIPQVMRKLKAGQRLTVDAWDRDFKTRLATGRLLTVDNQVDPNTGTVRFKATFPNQDNALFPNQFVNARLLIDMKRNTVLIPAGAVQRGPQNPFVFVVKPDSTVEMRNVAVGPVEKDTASIDKGLAAGETVVTEGVDKLQQGTKVSVGNRPSQRLT